MALRWGLFTMGPPLPRRAPNPGLLRRPVYDGASLPSAPQTPASCGGQLSSGERLRALPRCPTIASHNALRACPRYARGGAARCGIRYRDGSCRGGRGSSQTWTSRASSLLGRSPVTLVARLRASPGSASRISGDKVCYAPPDETTDGSTGIVCAARLELVGAAGAARSWPRGRPRRARCAGLARADVTLARRGRDRRDVEDPLARRGPLRRAPSRRAVGRGAIELGARSARTRARSS